MLFHRKLLTLLCSSACLIGIPSLSAEGLNFLRLSTDPSDGLVVESEAGQLIVEVARERLPEGRYRIEIDHEDRYGMRTELPDIELPAGAERWKHSIAWQPNHYGFERRHVRLRELNENRILEESRIDLINVVPLPRLSDAERMNSPIGVNVGYAVQWEALSKMGIHWARDYTWARVAANDLSADCQSYRQIKQLADWFGIEILPVIQKHFRTSDERFFIDDMERIRETYTRMSQRFPEIKYWELDNEADIKHPDTTTPAYQRWFESYLGYIEAASHGLAMADQNAQVVLNGEAGIWPDRARQLINLQNEHFSVVNFHYYTGPVPPEYAEKDFNTGGETRPQTVSFLDNMRRITDIAHAGDNEAWFTEIGWSAERGPAVGTRLQCAYLQRVYLLARWTGTEKVFWFWDRDLPGEGRFSDTGLLSNGQARAAGAAMAFLSKMTARAEYLGSVESGPHRWILVFQQPDHRYTVTAWSVGGQQPLPAPLKDASEAYGMFGNPLVGHAITDEPAYFHLDRLPATWKNHLEFEWETPTLLNSTQGGAVDVAVRGGNEQSLRWTELPQGVSSGDWSRQGASQKTTLRLPPDISEGRYPITLATRDASGGKSLRATLVVRKGLLIRSDAFGPESPARIEIESLLTDPIQVDFTTDRGQVEPSSLFLMPNETASLLYDSQDIPPSPESLQVFLNNGVTQTHTLRPSSLALPRIESIEIDGQLEDWPSERGLLPARAFIFEGPDGQIVDHAQLAWSEDGLYLGLKMRLNPDFRFTTSPTKFWESSGLECFVQAPGQPSHQLWFTPMRDDSGNIRLYGGEWANQTAGIATTYDDDRCERAASIQNDLLVMEVKIPADLLKGRLKKDTTLQFSINLKQAQPLMPRTLNSWPNSFGHKPEYWGRLLLQP